MFTRGAWREFKISLFYKQFLPCVCYSHGRAFVTTSRQRTFPVFSSATIHAVSRAKHTWASLELVLLGAPLGIREAPMHKKTKQKYTLSFRFRVAQPLSPLPSLDLRCSKAIKLPRSLFPICSSLCSLSALCLCSKRCAEGGTSEWSLKSHEKGRCRRAGPDLSIPQTPKQFCGPLYPQRQRGNKHQPNLLSTRQGRPHAPTNGSESGKKVRTSVVVGGDRLGGGICRSCVGAQTVFKAQASSGRSSTPRVCAGLGLVLRGDARERRQPRK